jgi:hypothetical protein
LLKLLPLFKFILHGLSGILLHEFEDHGYHLLSILFVLLLPFGLIKLFLGTFGRLSLNRSLFFLFGLYDDFFDLF